MTGGRLGVGSVFLGVTEHFRPLETWYVNYRTCGCQQKSFKRITWVPKIPKDRGDRFRNGSQRQQTWNAQMPSFYAQWCWATSSWCSLPPNAVARRPKGYTSIISILARRLSNWCLDVSVLFQKYLFKKTWERCRANRQEDGGWSAWCPLKGRGFWGSHTWHRERTYSR